MLKIKVGQGDQTDQNHVFHYLFDLLIGKIQRVHYL